MGYFLIGLFFIFVHNGWMVTIVAWGIGLSKILPDWITEISGRQWENAYRNSLKMSGSTDTMSDNIARNFANKMCKNTYHKDYYIPTKEEQDSIARKYGCNPDTVNYDYQHLGYVFYWKYYGSLSDINGKPVRAHRPVAFLVAKKEGIDVEIVNRILNYSEEIAEREYQKAYEEWKSNH